MPEDDGRSERGREGERAARQYLERRGLRFRGANVRVPGGELDLVMEDQQRGELVIVEVRTRRSSRFGTPEESLTISKRRALARSIAWLIAKERWTKPYRLDVVGVVVSETVPPQITHTEYVLLT